MNKSYRHEPFTDFTLKQNQQLFSQALQKVDLELGREHDLLIDGKRIKTEKKITSINPADKHQIVGYVSQANQELVEKAIQSASQAFKSWRKTDPDARAHILLRAAHMVRKRKHEFSAYLVREAGKPWKEADADTAEAVDFMEYYARQMMDLKAGKPIQSRDNESNRYIYQPLGVTVVVPPWNFAFAIMCGTTVAPFVCGNTVLLKPASATPVIAAKFIEVLQEAGMPAGVIQFIPGSGSEIGNYLIDHPQTSLISFTGSREVGTRIYERAAKVHHEQQHLKRVIVEMGGKDTIIVDAESDLDLAAESIMTSAFGFSGQKCSAGSRVIVLNEVYNEVLAKTVSLSKQISLGNPSTHDIYMGPVIDQAAYDKIMGYIELGMQEGRLVLGGKGDCSKGYYIEPTIFADVHPDKRIMQEEIFGPVVAFTRARSFNQAIEIANNTEYGLTGAVISNNRVHLEQAIQDFHVGNLYFNRNCTGAIVGYQPFGGFKMSGTDAKAGGPDYLTLHMQAKTISEMF